MKTDFLFVWILPPLLGAVIGYFTNWLAIKMLFRPHAEVRLFGLRLPFTPGLIPHEKPRLAAAIGKTVAEEFFTPEALAERLLDPLLRKSMEENIERALDGLFAMDAGAAFRGLEAEGSGELGGFVQEAWRGFAASEAFGVAVAEAFRSGLGLLERVRLSEILPAERSRELAAYLLSEERVRAMEQAFMARLEALFEEPGAYSAAFQGRELAEASGMLVRFDDRKGQGKETLLPPELLEPIVRLLGESLYRAAVPVIEEFLRRPEMRRSLEMNAAAIVRNAIGRLNLLQRLIVGAAQYERSIVESLPETVEDMIEVLSELLRSPEMPARAAEAAAEALRSSSLEGMGAFLRRIIGRDALMAAAAASFEALRAGGPELAEKLSRRLSADPEASIGTLLASSGFDAEELVSRASAAFLKAIRSWSEDSGLLGSMGGGFARGLGSALEGRRLGKVLGLQPDFSRRLSVYAAGKAVELVSREADRILEGLDVERMVAEKIESLDMNEVERIILSVADKELRWITILGGILGGLIGFLQSFLYLLAP